jgi:tetratricopeptide (TPR) repeat protein
MEEAVALAERLGDDKRLTRVLAVQTNALWFAGDNPRARESGERVLALAEAAGHRVHQVHAGVNLALVCQTMGDARRAAGLFARVIELLSDGLEGDRLGRTLYPAVLARNELAIAYAELGEFDSAVAISRDAVRLAESIGHSTTLLQAQLEACAILLRRGDFHEAIPRLKSAIAALQAAGLRVFVTSGSAMLGYSYAMTGRLRDRIELPREAIAQSAHSRRTGEARLTVYLCEAHPREGAVGGGPGACRACPEPGSSARRAGHGSLALHLLGDIAGERHYVAALALAEDLGMRPLVAHCHLGLGKLYRRTGQREQANEHLTTATTMYRDMDMRFWLEQAEAGMRELA